MGRRWKNRYNNKLILTEIFPSVHETWYLKLWNSILTLKIKSLEVFDALLYDVEFNLTGL